MDKSKIPAGQRQALGALMDDHRAVKKLFKSFEESKSNKESIAGETCNRLSMHARIEDEIFYPALRGVSGDLDDLLDEAKVEHGVAKDLIAAIRRAADSDRLEATYKVLTEYVGHHVEEEEGGCLSSSSSEMLTSVRWQRKRLRERKKIWRLPRNSLLFSEALEPAASGSCGLFIFWRAMPKPMARALRCHLGAATRRTVTERKMAEQPQSEQTPEDLDQEQEQEQEQEQPEKAGEEEMPEEPVEQADTEGEKT